ncbi:hypothetical protein A4U53_021985 [Rhizobium ruizarguesonis]|uniref:Uncharacterized protein n=1 Tax=Rhizobium ruizarguesonis TaxID=2081791 RepID=A0ACD5EJ22_9HYPH
MTAPNQCDRHHGADPCAIQALPENDAGKDRRDDVGDDDRRLRRPHDDALALLREVHG